MREAQNPWNHVKFNDLCMLFGRANCGDHRSKLYKNVFGRHLQHAQTTMSILKVEYNLRRVVEGIFKNNHTLVQFWCKTPQDIDTFVVNELPKEATENELAFARVVVYAHLIGLENDYCAFLQPSPPYFLKSNLQRLMQHYTRSSKRYVYVQRSLENTLQWEKERFSYLECVQALNKGKILIVLPSDLPHTQDFQIFLNSLFNDLISAHDINQDMLVMDAIAPCLHKKFVSELLDGIQENWEEEGIKRTFLAYKFLVEGQIHREEFKHQGVVHASWKEGFAYLAFVVLRKNRCVLENIPSHNFPYLMQEYTREALDNIPVDRASRQQEISLLMQQHWNLDTPMSYDLESFVQYMKELVNALCDGNAIGASREPFLILLEKGIREREYNDLQQIYRPDPSELTDPSYAKGFFVLMNVDYLKRSAFDIGKTIVRPVYLKKTIQDEMSYLERRGVLMALARMYYIKMSDPVYLALF